MSRKEDTNGVTGRLEEPTPLKRLARILYEEMEHLDPGCEPYVEWEDLRWRDKELYTSCVERLLQETDLVHKHLANNDVVSRHPQTCKKLNDHI